MSHRCAAGAVSEHLLIYLYGNENAEKVMSVLNNIYIYIPNEYPPHVCELNDFNET